MLNFEHSIEFGDKSLRVFSEVIIELLQLLKQANKLLLWNCFQNILVVFTEEEKLSTSASSIATHDLVQLLAVLNKVETLVDTRYVVLTQQMLEYLRRVDRELSIQK